MQKLLSKKYTVIAYGCGVANQTMKQHTYVTMHIAFQEKIGNQTKKYGRK